MFLDKGGGKNYGGRGTSSEVLNRRRQKYQKRVYMDGLKLHTRLATACGGGVVDKPWLKGRGVVEPRHTGRGVSQLWRKG